MPHYAYQCPAGHTHERLHSIKRKPDQQIACTSPDCGHRMQLQMTGGVGFNTHPVTSKFPYVSSRLPHELPGCRTHGPLKKTVVESKQHLLRINAEHGYATED